MVRKVSEKRKVIHDQWESRISSWESSGISQVKFCIENELNLRNFQYWKKKFKDSQRLIVAKANDSSIKIVEVKKDQFFENRFQSLNINPSMRINIRDMSIDLNNSFCDEALSRLIRVLRIV